MKTSTKIISIIFLALIMIIGIRTFSGEDDWICSNGKWIKHGNPSSPMPTSFCKQTCETDNDCKTPMDFLVQSNCPFTSLCIEDSCKVVCPLISDTFTCYENKDCDCKERGDRTIACICHDNTCMSIEAE